MAQTIANPRAAMTITSTNTPSSTPPNQSLYIQNLPEKLQKEDLRRSLYILFSTYGPVLDVTALKTKKMRGQAHVLFRDVGSATQALRSCQGMEFFGREMRISYSRNRSNTLAKLTGTFNGPSITENGRPQTLQAGANTTPSSFPAPPGVNASTLPGAQAVAKDDEMTEAPSAQPPAPTVVEKLKGDADGGAPSPQGTKRGRDESDEEEAEMEVEEEEEEGAMEMSDDDD